MTAGVPRRERVRKGFTSPKGVAFLSSISGPAKGRPMGPAAGKKQESTTSVRKVDHVYDQEKDK
jgi:hypothetical protein